MCNGNTAQCPTSTPKENLTSCHSNTQVCLSGVGAVSWAVCSFCTAPIECFLFLGIDNAIKSLNVKNLMSKYKQILHLITVMQFDLFVFTLAWNNIFMLAQMHTHENFQALNISHCICVIVCVIVVFVLRTFCLRMSFLSLSGLLWLYLSEAWSRCLHLCHWGGERRDRAVSCVLYGEGWVTLTDFSSMQSRPQQISST